MHLKNIESMYTAVEANRGFDVIIVVCSSQDQAEYWQHRLEASRGSVIGRGTQVIAVEEDWPGGAGQLLGTLYAWKKASATHNLARILEEGRSVAMYHTAGKGTRMAPLPAAEANNKSAIKLPRLLEIDGKRMLLTVLEAVIFQTGIFAPSRLSRLCVFWGDQVFIPSEIVDCARTHHAEILDIRSELPLDEETWKREWQSYGLIVPCEGGQCLQREKQTWEQVRELLAHGIAGSDRQGRTILGKSLGSFSISQEFLGALLEEFSPELERKHGKMDTDPHLWMPLTSDRDDFVSRGGEADHWQRITQFKERFLARHGDGVLLFGDRDIGKDTLWWDYGQVRLYHENFLKALEDSHEGECLRKFYDLEKHWVKKQSSEGLDVENSILVDSHVRGRIRNSVLMRVDADDLDVSDSVMVDSSISRARADRALFYNCIDLKNLNLASGQVVTDVFLPDNGPIRMWTELQRDGKDDWEKVLPGNPYSYEHLGRVVSAQLGSGFAAERSKWMTYYENRKNLDEALDTLRSSFIKPAIDNLVEIVWGGDNIEKLKGLPSSGKLIGESWECSTHHKHPSLVPLGEKKSIPLNDVIAMIPEEILGNHIAREFRGRLPILFKFLDAREDLSVQVHPTDEKAAELGETDTGKTEAWVILHAEPGAVLYLGFKEDVDQEQFQRDLTDPNVNIAEKYLNAFPAKPGDIFFNPSGAAHAIGKGIFLAEIQQSSGITYRVWDWNREPKRELHIPQAMQSFNFCKTTEADYKLIPRRIGDHEERLIDSFYFTVDRIRLQEGESLHQQTLGSFQVLTCLEGKVELSSHSSREQLAQGESLLVPAIIDEYTIRASEQAIILKSFVLQPAHIDPVIFQTYDVRAIADKYLSDRVCYYLGKGYGTFLRRLNQAESGDLWVAIGGGVRISTERIRKYLIKGIISTGVNVYNVGVTSTPELYFSIPYLEANGGINITASHNEAEYNGLKQVIRTEDDFITSINADQMLEIKRTVLEGDFLEGNGQNIRIEEGEVVRYHNELVKANCRLGRRIWVDLLEQWHDRGVKALLNVTSALEFPDSKDTEKWGSICRALGLPPDTEQPDTAVRYPLEGLEVVIDFGNGSAWRTRSVYSDLGADVIALNEDPDGSFPAHIPDPIKAKYRIQLEEAVLKEASVSKKEVVGIGNDEDADRVIYVRKDGRVVEGDRTLAIQAKSIIEEHKRLGLPGKPRFMGEVKFSRVAEEFVNENGGEYIMSPTGFAFIKDGTKELIRALRAGKPEVNLFGRRIDLRANREPIVLAAELSGHQMSGHEENWIFDDSLLAATKVLTVIAKGLKEGKSFIDIDESVPRYPATPELNIRLETNVLGEKQEIVEKVVQTFRSKGYMIDTTDGGLIKWFDENGQWQGQALVRKSNTQPMIICRVEGKDENAKQTIENEFFAELLTISTPAVPQLNLASDDYIKGILPRIKSPRNS